MIKKIFKVKGMKCQHCKTNIEKAVKKLEYVSNAEVDLEKGSLTIEYDESVIVSNKQIKEAVEGVGRFELIL